jgi:hypothetical protein
MVSGHGYGQGTKTSTKTKTKPAAMTINPDQDNIKNVNMLLTFSPRAPKDISVRVKVYGQGSGFG